MKIDKFKDQSEWDSWVDKTITKHSGKKFSNGMVTAIVVELGINPYTNKKAFKIEDGNYIDCYQTKLY